MSDHDASPQRTAKQEHRRSLTELRHFVPGQLLEVTLRCFQSRFLMLPIPEFEPIFLGVMGRAQQLYEMEICDFAVLSNHLHLLLIPEDKDRLEGFQRYLASNLSREVGRLHDWEGGIFRRRYSSVPVTDEPEAQMARRAYLLAQSMKEKLCPSSELWIGPHSAKSWARGESVVEGGIWTDRTALFEARREYDRFRKAENPRLRRSKPRVRDFQTPVSVKLSKIPCCQHLSDQQYQQSTADLLEAKRREHAEEIAQVPADWKRRILRQSPFDAPQKTAKRPKPYCHAATKAARMKFREMLKAWIDAYAQAADRFRKGVLEAIGEFPDNAYLPRFAVLPDVPQNEPHLVPDTS